MPVANGVLPKFKGLSVLRTEWLEGLKHASRERSIFIDILVSPNQNCMGKSKNSSQTALRNMRFRPVTLAFTSAVVLLLEVKAALL